MKPLINPQERAFAETMSRLVVCNHFLPERILLEREALGAEFVDGPAAAWNLEFASNTRSPNVLRLIAKTNAIVEKVRRRLSEGARLAVNELELYEDLVNYELYERYRGSFEALTLQTLPPKGAVKWCARFYQDMRDHLEPARQAPLLPQEMAHHLAGVWQVERAFVNIFRNIVGSSPSVARLRASVWESIFTCNFRRYRNGLFERMHEIATLITGPSGTGKELVARAIASSAYIPFDPNAQRFVVDHHQLFYPINLSALSSNLIESELFGHKRGAFTGALQDHAGWLEVCPERGSVFLDEIGEIDAALQVKLLRVLQTRNFHRLGESRLRSFPGKIIAATNRDLAAEIQAGCFREDFYYRLCSDIIRAPSLREQLQECPGDLPRLVRFIARQFVSSGQEEALAAEVLELVEHELPADYPWPGNFRELEQCVRNVLVRRRYEPVRVTPQTPAAALAADFEAATITADELLRRYCRLVYSRTGNLEETARRLNLDRRTVKSRVGL